MTDKSKPRPLTAKQFSFCKWYVSAECFGNGTESARRASYKGSDNTLATVAKENLRKPHIAAMIDELMDAATAGANITIERVLKDIHRRGEQAEADGNHAAALKATELQGKYLKMWVERIEHIQHLDEISDDQLYALVTKLMEKTGVDLFAAARGNGAEGGAVPGAPGAGKPH